MPFPFLRVDYSALNARQQENYNYYKLSAVLADFGYVTMRLSDDWNGADLIAQHIDGSAFLRVQLKGRLTFDRSYIGKGLAVAFPMADGWYLYPHDELLDIFFRKGRVEGTVAWQRDGNYHFPTLGQDVLQLDNAVPDSGVMMNSSYCPPTR